MSTLHDGAPVTIGNLELIPIEVTNIGAERIAGSLVAFATKEPLAVVIRSPQAAWALDLEGGETSLEDLLREVPGLRERLREP